MAAQDVSENRRPSAVDRSGDRGGSISMVLAVALLLVGSVIAFLFIGRANAQPYILALLSVLFVQERTLGTKSALERDAEAAV